MVGSQERSKGLSPEGYRLEKEGGKGGGSQIEGTPWSDFSTGAVNSVPVLSED